MMDDTRPFRNIIPRPRAERRAQRNKELLEKQRLAHRKEGFVRHEDVASPLRIDATASYFMSDADRFHTDTAGEERVVRERERDRKRNIVDRRREERVDREESRWRRMEASEEDDKKRWEQTRGVSQTNRSSVAFNVLTLEYEQNSGGDQLRKEDEQARYRAAMRAQKLYSKTSSEGYDPITGEPLLPRLQVPKISK